MKSASEFLIMTALDFLRVRGFLNDDITVILNLVISPWCSGWCSAKCLAKAFPGCQFDRGHFVSKFGYTFFGNFAFESDKKNIIFFLQKHRVSQEGGLV